MNDTNTAAFNPIIENPITDTTNNNNDNHNVPLMNEYNDLLKDYFKESKQ